MDDLSRRRLSKDHSALRNAVKVDADMGVHTPMLNAELDRIGIPPHADFNAASVMLGLPGGMMMARGFALEPMKEILEISMRAAPSEAYDIDSLDGISDALDEFTTSHAWPSNPEHIAEYPVLVSLWARMFRNAYCEMVFAIEDAIDVDKTDVEIADIAKNACMFLVETFWIASNPESAS